MMTIRFLPLVLLLGGCPNSLADEESHPCTLAQNCVYNAADGTSTCEEGYEWQDSNDISNYNCVEMEAMSLEEFLMERDAYLCRLTVACESPLMNKWGPITMTLQNEFCHPKNPKKALELEYLQADLESGRYDYNAPSAQLCAEALQIPKVCSDFPNHPNLTRSNSHSLGSLHILGAGIVHDKVYGGFVDHLASEHGFIMPDPCYEIFTGGSLSLNTQAADEPCVYHQHCQKGHYCKNDFNIPDAQCQQLCQPFHSTAESCTNDSQCSPNDFCNNTYTSDDACRPQEGFQPGENCYVSSSTSDPMAKCDGTFLCTYSGTDTKRCNPGRAIGEACSLEEDIGCAAGGRCFMEVEVDLTTGEEVTSSLCVALSEPGGPCEENKNCPFSFECLEERCVPAEEFPAYASNEDAAFLFDIDYRGVNESCAEEGSTNPACLGTHWACSPETQTCQPVVSLAGDACASGQQWPCLGLSICVEGVCQEYGANCL